MTASHVTVSAQLTKPAYAAVPAGAAERMVRLDRMTFVRCAHTCCAYFRFRFAGTFRALEKPARGRVEGAGSGNTTGRSEEVRELGTRWCVAPTTSHGVINWLVGVLLQFVAQIHRSQGRRHREAE